MSITRRKFLWAASGGVAGLATLGAVGRLEADHPEVERLDLFLPRLPGVFDGITVAQLTDFHYDPRFTRVPIEVGVRTISALHPDLVVLTGDFVTAPLMGGLHRSSMVPGIDACAALLAGLRAPLGIFGVLGNHDEYYNPKRILAPLNAAGIHTLRNQAVALERDGKRLWIAGINDVIFGEPDPALALRPIPAGEATILLCHEPDFADSARRYPVDLQLSGHSHGGQVVLPLAGALYLPPMGRKYPRGLRDLGSLAVYTSRGIGTVRVPLRLHCPPEITLITLRSGPRTPVAGARISADPGKA